MNYLVNRYIEKIAIGIDQLRKATTKIPNLVRRGWYMNLGKLMEMSKKPNIKVKDTMSVFSFNPKDGFYTGPMTDPIKKKIFAKGDLTKVLGNYGIFLPTEKLTPLQRETINRTGLLHERFEEAAIKKHKTLRNASNYINRNAADLARVKFFTHASPEVILKEHNVIATLPKNMRGPINSLLENSRILDQSTAGIRSVFPKFQYGKQRISRHAIKNMTNSLIRSGVFTPGLKK